MNFKAFVCLNELFILKQKIQSCWTILYKFGYDEKLSLSQQYLSEKCANDFDENNEYELSQDGIDFIKNIWNLYTHDNVTDISIVDKIFSPMGTGCPFSVTKITNIQNNQIKLKTWISIWQ